MPAQRRTPFPEAAIAWMVGDSPRRILDLGSDRGQLARILTDSGHRVHCMDRSVEKIAHIAARIPTGIHVVAQAESLPFAGHSFDVVSSAETLHLFAPGLTAPEIARVLRPGGRLVAIYNTRDDTVPWVKKLARILQDVDPHAMRSDFGQGSVAAMTETPYFTELQRRNFRNWLPIDRPALLDMVRKRPATIALDDTVRDALLAEVGDLYDTYARSPEPLLLPFQASCWRARVDHRELALTGADDGLEIPLGF